MDRYVRVEQARQETPCAPNEVRITATGKSRNYISYATGLLLEKNHPSIILKAMGKAINKTVTIAEIIKRRIPDLHQLTAISSVDITDVWEPTEEGLDRIETTRHVSVITITLSKEALDTSASGYQAPLPESEVRPLQDEDHLAGEADGEHPEGPGGEGGRSGRGRGRGGRGEGRGGRGRGHGRGRGPPREADPTPAADAADAAAAGPPAEGRRGSRGGRGRGRGRGARGGRGGRGRGRGEEGEGASTAPAAAAATAAAEAPPPTAAAAGAEAPAAAAPPTAPAPAVEAAAE